MSEFVVVHTTTDTEENAKAIAHQAVERRLAACVQVFPIQSVFRWNGTVESATEYRCEFKTQADHADALRLLIQETHTYDVPEVVELAIHKMSANYQSWLSDQLLED